MAKKKRPYGEVREMIISASFDIVSNEGLEALSARKIATTIGYTVGTLYNIFSNMDEILLYLNNRVLNFFIEGLTTKLSENKGGAVDGLLIIAKHYVLFSEEHYHLWHLLFIKKNLLPQSELPTWYIAKVGNLQKIVMSQIEKLNIPHADIAVETCIYWAGVHGVASLNKSGKFNYISPKEVVEILENTVNRIFAGVVRNA